MNKRKGITPIIAIVLLLMMTVAAGGFAWTFIQSTIDDAQETTAKNMEDMNTRKVLRVIQGQCTGGAGTNCEDTVLLPYPTPGDGTEITLSIKNTGQPLALPGTTTSEIKKTLVLINGAIDGTNGQIIGTYSDKACTVATTKALTDTIFYIKC